MPSGKRNATPGPSNLGRRVNGAQDASASPGTGQGRYNNVAKKKESKEKDKERQRTLKRPGSEDVVDEDEREKKKSRFGSIGEENCDDDVVGPKDNKERDKKRKRRRRRKKPSSVAADGGETSQREMSLVALRSSSEMGLGGSHGAEPVNFPPVGVDRVEKQKTPSHTSSKKGKGKANLDVGLESTPASRSDTLSTGLGAPDEITRLKEQLAEQRQLLEKHQSHLIQQQQTLTCQICLELMHRPYALTPCGHVTCYGCLVRWFTSDPNAQDAEQQANENYNDVSGLLNNAAARRGTFIRRRKTCPVCRGSVLDRPVEMWDIKQMVAALVKSHLVDLPGPPAGGGEEGGGTHGGGGSNATNDPWRNVFRPRGVGVGHRANLQPVGPENDLVDRENLGWYDHEDGGVYRCIDCFHEIWAGMCSGCQRIYRGHNEEEEEEEEDLFYDDQMAPFGFYDDDDDDIEEDHWFGHSEDDGFEGLLRHGVWPVGGDIDVDGETDVDSVEGWGTVLRNAGGVERDNWRAELRSDSESSDDVGGGVDVDVDAESSEDGERSGWRMRVRIVDDEEDEEDEEGTGSERVRTWVSQTDSHVEYFSEGDDEGTDVDDASGDGGDEDTEGEEGGVFSATLSRRGTRARRTLVSSEESEDEDPPTPNRRRSIRLAVRGRVVEVEVESE